MLRLLFFLPLLAFVMSRKVTLCQNESELMDCGNNGQIKIHSAKWGRRNSDTCPSRWGWESEECEMVDYTKKIRRYCNGKSSCEVEADGYHFSYYKCFFNQPYAEIIYSCARITTTTERPTQPPQPKEVCVKAGSVKLLHCPRGKSVKISDGAISDHPCTDSEEEGSGAAEENNCEGFEIPAQRLFDVQCNMMRKQTCLFTFSPIVYKTYGRKPCPQSKHYLHGSYTCQ